MIHLASTSLFRVARRLPADRPTRYGNTPVTDCRSVAAGILPGTPPSLAMQDEEDYGRNQSEYTGSSPDRVGLIGVAA